MPFATTADIQTRLVRTLTAEETAAAALLLLAVQAEIEQITGAAQADMSPEPDVLRFIAIEAVCRELASPVGAESTAESLGAYSYRVGYRETGGTFLTQSEELRIRQAVGELSGSTRLQSLVHEYVTEDE